MIKKHWKTILIIMALIILGTSIGAVYAATVLNSTEVTYNKAGNTIAVNTALDELYATAKNAATKVYSQGQLVKYKNDTFYSLYDVASTDTTMEIFAIYNLNSTGTAQVNDTYSNYKCAFSGSRYWSSTNQNINNIPGGDTDVQYCVPRIKKYALDKGAINGRLLTYEEAYVISRGTNADAKNMLWGRLNTNQTDSSGKPYLYYWLGSSYSNYANNVWDVNGLYSRLGDYIYSNSDFDRGPPSFNSLNI